MGPVGVFGAWGGKMWGLGGDELGLGGTWGSWGSLWGSVREELWQRLPHAPPAPPSLCVCPYPQPETGRGGDMWGLRGGKLGLGA